jgi:hypothetical protein
MTQFRPFQMQPSGLLTGKNREDLAEYPPSRFSAGANASLTNQAAQWIPVGSGAATSLTAIAYQLAVRNDQITTAVIRYIGDAANVAGQTITFFGRLNGATFLIVAGLPSTANAHTSRVTFATPIDIAVGDVLELGLEPSAALTAVLTLVAVSLGS